MSLSLRVDARVIGNAVDARRRPLIVITGANRGGKSTFLRSVGVAQLMMQCGMFVGASSYRGHTVTRLFTHFKREEDAGMSKGKFDEELSRMSDIANQLVPDAMVLFNESFASTNEREGSEIAAQVFDALLDTRVTIAVVTHMYDLAGRLLDQKPDQGLFLRAERQLAERVACVGLADLTPSVVRAGSGTSALTRNADRGRLGGHWDAGDMHQITGVRDPAAAFPLPTVVDDASERRQANRAVAVGAAGLALTGLIELAVAILSGSVGLLGDALHNLSDVSTSLVVFLGFRVSRRAATERYPYGFERAEDLAGVGIAVVIWASAGLAGAQSIHKLLEHGTTSHVGWGIAGAAVGIAGNQLVARYKLTIGRRINSATLIADARHSWLDALSSAGALVGLIGVSLGARWADPVAGLVVTVFICHVGWEVTSDVVHRLMDGVDPEIISTAESIAMQVPGVQHAHAQARWTGRTLRLAIEAWLDADTTLTAADATGRAVASHIARDLPAVRSFTWTSRPV